MAPSKPAPRPAHSHPAEADEASAVAPSGASEAVTARHEPEAPPPPLPADRLINRELSWLAFNERVLAEADNPHHPLLERLRFLSISANNLDEFYMVRVAGLKGQRLAGIQDLSQDGLHARRSSSTRSTARRRADARTSRSAGASCDVELAAPVGIAVLRPADLGAGDRDWLEARFMAEIFPVLTPLAIDPAHPFPFIANRGFGLALRSGRSQRRRPLAALILLPASDRALHPPARRRRPVPAARQMIVLCFSTGSFPAFEPARPGLFPRAARQRGRDRGGGRGSGPLFETRAQAAAPRPRHPSRRSRARCRPICAAFLIERARCRAGGCLLQPGLLGLGRRQAADRSTSARIWSSRPTIPRFPERIRDFGGDCFAAIRQKDIIVHHPYESFDVVVQFLRQAARDPAVVAIKQTLYRTSEDSPIVAALIEAAEAGKSVTALIELKARFDEEANIRWARDLERAGVQVVYGFTAAEDARQGLAGGAPRRRRAAHLRPFRDRQLSSGHGQGLHRPVVLHLRSGAVPATRRGCSTS